MEAKMIDKSGASNTAGEDRAELVKALRERYSSLQTDMKWENFYWVRTHAVEIIAILDEIKNLEDRERTLCSLVKWYPELPLTPERYEAFQQKRPMGITELNQYFAPLGLHFRRFSVGGGRAIWYTHIGMSVSDACKAAAANVPKETEQAQGDAKRVLRYEHHAGDAWYGDTATITEITLTTAEKFPQFNEEARTRYHEVRDMMAETVNK
jgi:hypothetical protein